MAEKDQKPLSINDILDQLVKPSVIQGQKDQTVLPYSSAQKKTDDKTVPQQIKTGESKGFSLPNLNEVKNNNLSQRDAVNLSSNISKPYERKLSIRTMADDLIRLKQGQRPVGLETKKVLFQAENIPKNDKKELKDESKIKTPEPTIPQAISRPPVFSMGSLKTSPKLPILSTPEPQVYGSPLPVGPSILDRIRKFFSSGDKVATVTDNIEKNTEIKSEEVEKKEITPPYLGAPVFKKQVTNPQDEKVEYGIIARVIGSGMTTGILSTIVIAVAVYFALSYFVFNSDNEAVITPLPTQLQETAIPPEINELETIFKSVSRVPFQLTGDVQLIPEFREFIEKESINEKEFKKVDFILSTSGTKVNGFTQILDSFAIKYPADLKEVIKDNNVVFLYGQQEVFDIYPGDKQEATPARGIVFVVEITDKDRVVSILRNWEGEMPQDFKDIFKIEPLKEATGGFLDNNRQGVVIRYKNFPLPDKSVDYSIVPSLSGRYYLIVTNSRESMYSPIDRIRGL